MATIEKLDTAKNSLQRIHNFDPTSLARTGDLGKELNFEEVVPDAERLINLYKRIPVSILEDFSDDLLSTITTQANGDYSRLDSILKFSPSQGGTSQARIALIASVKNAYDSSFGLLWQYIAYGVSRVTDTSILESQARSTLQAMQDNSNKLTDSLNENKKEADKILETIRAVAAEQGVSQQAKYFKDEADLHEKEAKQWQKKVYWIAGCIGSFAVLSLFLHKLPYISPSDSLESAQLISSKILIFAILGYLLVLAAKNFLSHKHNSVVNRHRQNALLTYKAIADAAHGKGTEDIILANAASCIYSPQETGYFKSGGEPSVSSKTVLELLTKAPAN